MHRLFYVQCLERLRVSPRCSERGMYCVFQNLNYLCLASPVAIGNHTGKPTSIKRGRVRSSEQSK